MMSTQKTKPTGEGNPQTVGFSFVRFRELVAGVGFEPTTFGL